MSQDYMAAYWIPTTHYWSGRHGYTPRWIILHGSGGGGSAEAHARGYQTNDPPTSAHYVIGLRGEIIQCVAETDSAWGNGVLSAGHDPWWSPQINPNFATLSIEHVKPDGANRNQLTQAQQAASFELIRQLCAKWNIPARAADASGGITGHHSVDPANRGLCPGAYPWDELWAYLRMGAAPSGLLMTAPASGVLLPSPASGVLPTGATVGALAAGPSGSLLAPAPASGSLYPASPSGYATALPTAGLVSAPASGGPVGVAPRAPRPLPLPAGYAPAGAMSAPAGYAPVGAMSAPAASAATTASVPTGWRDDGTTLVAPNGFQVTQAFRSYVLSRPWDASNWPLENAQPANPVDVTNPQSGRGSLQHFRQTIIVWEEASGAVYELWAGAAALAWEQRAVSTAQSTAQSTARVAMPPSGTLAPTSAYAPSAYAPSASAPSASAPSAYAPVPYGLAGMAASAPSASITTSALPSSLLPGTSATRALPGVAAGVAAAVSAAAGSAMAPLLSYVPTIPAPQPSGLAGVGDLLGQRVGALERDIKTLVNHIAGSPKARSKLEAELAQDAGQIGDLIVNPGGRRGILSNPRSLLRWVLMILGVLLSEAATWMISAVAHNTPHLQMPFVTVGTLASGVVFLSALVLRPHG